MEKVKKENVLRKITLYNVDATTYAEFKFICNLNNMAYGPAMTMLMKEFIKKNKK